MKPITWTQLLILYAGIEQTWVVKAQDVRFPSRGRIDSLINPPLMKQWDRMPCFEKTVQDIGILTEGDAPRACSFTYTNVSKTPVVIIRVRIICGYTATDAYAGRMLPGEMRTITSTYHPKNHPGAINTNIFIHLSSSDRAPVARPILVGDVVPGADERARYPYIMGKLRLKQNQLKFREIAAGKQPSERTLCSSNGDKSIRSSAFIVPKSVAFRTEQEVTQSGSEADVVVTINTSLILAEKGKSFTFPIILEEVNARPSDRTLNVKVNCVKQR